MAILTESVAPVMVAAFGIGPDTAAEMLIVAGDNPDRVRSEPAWAKPCGVCPARRAAAGRVAAGSIVMPSPATAALYRTIIVRLRFWE